MVKSPLMGAFSRHGRFMNIRIENSIQVQDDIEPPQNIRRHYRSNLAAPLANIAYLEIMEHKKRLLPGGK
jgi:hypothetical protein